MSKKDYYEILGLTKGATEAEIKSAFRKLAKQYHPDVNKETGSEAKFKEISEAYSVLSDPQKKAQYDQFGHDAFQGGGAGGFSGYNGFSGFGGFEDIDLSDILGDIFGSSFGFGGRKNKTRSTKGRDSLVQVELTFEEAIFGTKKTLNLELDETCDECSGAGGFDKVSCSTCSGRGKIVSEQRTMFGTFQSETTCSNCHGSGESFKNTCSKCHGQGTIRGVKEIIVTVPEGVDNGSQIRLTGKGEAGRNGGANGDIYIEFVVQKHAIFERDGNDIYLEVPLTITEAVLGCKKEIPTIYGNVILEIKPGTQGQDKYKLKGKGIAGNSLFNKGDMFVIVKVLIPEKLSKEQKNLLDELAKTNLDDHPQINKFNKYLD